MPKLYAKDARPHHPFLDTYAHTVDYDTHFTSEADVRRAISGYSGLVSAMDENVGYVLRALRDAGLEHDTRSTQVTMATTSARAACGGSPRSTRSPPACR